MASGRKSSKDNIRNSMARIMANAGMNGFNGVYAACAHSVIRLMDEEAARKRNEEAKNPYLAKLRRLEEEGPPQDAQS